MRQSELMDNIVLTLFSYGIHNGVAIKGGYALNKLLDTRGTIDIDLSIGSLEFWSIMERALGTCGKELINKGYVDSYKIKRPDPDKEESGGIKFYIKDRKITGVDISIQNLGFGIQAANIPLCSEGIVTNINIPAYRFERMLGDKISASFSNKQFRRIKDLFDIYCIILSCTIDFRELTAALRDREFKVIAEVSPFRQEAFEQWKYAWEKFKLRNIDGQEINKPDLKDMLREYSRFISEYIRIIKSGENQFIWSNKDMRWIKC